jgi:hypothetical protein
MNVTPAEKQRAEGFIKRLEGARHEVAPPPPPPPSPPAGEPAKPEPPPDKGRIDAATIAATSLAVVGLGVGTVLGIKAVSDKPKEGFVTGRDGSYDDLRRAADSSHTEAVVADVGFAVGILGAAAAAYLYFSRPKIVPASPTTGSAAFISVAPSRSGGAFVLRGTF